MHQIKNTVAEKVSVVITNSSRSIMIASLLGSSCCSRSPSLATRMPSGIGRRRRQTIHSKPSNALVNSVAEARGAEMSLVRQEE